MKWILAFTVALLWAGQGRAQEASLKSFLPGGGKVAWQVKYKDLKLVAASAKNVRGKDTFVLVYVMQPDSSLTLLPGRLGSFATFFDASGKRIETVRLRKMAPGKKEIKQGDKIYFSLDVPGSDVLRKTRTVVLPLSAEEITEKLPSAPVAGGAKTPAPKQPPKEPARELVQVVSRASGKFLGVKGGGPAENAPLVQGGNASAPGRGWVLVRLGWDAGYKIVNPANGLVIGVRGGSAEDGAQIVQQRYDGSPGQHWSLTPVPRERGWWKIVNRKSGKVLDVAEGSKADGAKIVLWWDHGAANQHWKLQPVVAVAKAPAPAAPAAPVATAGPRAVELARKLIEAEAIQIILFAHPTADPRRLRFKGVEKTKDGFTLRYEFLGYLGFNVLSELRRWENEGRTGKKAVGHRILEAKFLFAKDGEFKELVMTYDAAKLVRAFSAADTLAKAIARNVKKNGPHPWAVSFVERAKKWRNPKTNAEGKWWCEYYLKDAQSARRREGEWRQWYWNTWQYYDSPLVPLLE